MALKRIIVFVAGILLTLAVLNHFGLQETITVLAGTRLHLIVLAIALQLVVLALLVLRIKILAYGKGYLSFLQATRITFSGMFVSMITPIAKFGGEPLKMYMLRRNIGSSNASAAITIESIMEMLSSIAVVAAVMLLFFNDIPPGFILTFLLFLLVTCLITGIVLKILLTPRWLRKIITWFGTRIARLLEAKARDYGDMFTTTFYDMLKNRKVILGTFFVSVIMKVIEVMRLWIIFLALNTFLPFKTVFIVWTIILILLFIPWLPGSLGFIEFSGIAAFIAFGLVSSVAASAMILDRLLTFWMPLFIGLATIYIAKQRGELPDLKGMNLRNMQNRKKTRY